MFVILFFILFSVEGKALRQDEICGDFDGRRMYLELGESGVLQAKNQLSEEYYRKKTEKGLPNRQCSLELITCPSCVVYIKFTFLNISRNCGKNTVLDSCGCDYVWIYEPPFEEVSGEQFCGHFVETNSSSLVYKSQTRSTAITFLFSSYHEHAFTLEYSSQRNRHYLDAYPTYSNMNNGSQFISSPFFPFYYPRDLNMEYVISCKTSDACRIRLIFTDFQVSTNSLIEFFDWNGQRMHVSTGTIFRPPLLISTGPTMVIRFYANGGTNLGFKASYMFLLGETNNSTLKPDTSCGGYVDNLGGGITMMDMIKENTKSYDCFWIIRPPPSYSHLKTHLYLKIISFSDFAGSTELVIRQGLTSNERVIEILRHPVSQYVIAKQKEHVVPITQGFYVSLKGLFRPESRLAIIYSAFNFKDCYSGSDFLCRNLRCIPAYLICDGFDHCGDNSDELTSCLKDSKDRIRWSHTPNFFFPKTDRYSYLKTATIVFVVCSLGLISLIFTLIILLYRINTRNRNQRHLQTHLQTINDMLEEGPNGLVEEEIMLADEPPHYEAPPGYDEVLKLRELEKEKKVRRKSPKRPSKGHRRPCSRCEDQVSISTQSSVGIISDIFPSTSRSCQTTPLPSAVPLTPPPCYATLPSIKITEVPDVITDTNFYSHYINISELTDVNSISENALRVERIGDNEANKFFNGTLTVADLEEDSKARVIQELSKSLSLSSITENYSRRRINSLDLTNKYILPFHILNRKSCVSDSDILLGAERVGEDRTNVWAKEFRNTRLRRCASIEALFK